MLLTVAMGHGVESGVHQYDERMDGYGSVRPSFHVVVHHLHWRILRILSVVSSAVSVRGQERPRNLCPRRLALRAMSLRIYIDDLICYTSII